jgi:hypothetical protein
MKQTRPDYTLDDWAWEGCPGFSPSGTEREAEQANFLAAVQRKKETAFNRAIAIVFGLAVTCLFLWHILSGPHYNPYPDDDGSGIVVE